MTKTTVESILKEWLVAHGFDGLSNCDDCGCGISDFSPCRDPLGNDGIPADCVPAYYDKELDGFIASETKTTASK